MKLNPKSLPKLSKPQKEPSPKAKKKTALQEIITGWKTREEAEGENDLY